MQQDVDVDDNVVDVEDDFIDGTVVGDEDCIDGNVVDDDDDRRSQRSTLTRPNAPNAH